MNKKQKQQPNGLYNTSKKSLKESFKPFDIISDKKGSLGLIQEVSVNQCQPEPYQISYSIRWFYGPQTKFAWFQKEDLVKHGNLFIIIAEMTCHPFGGNKSKVKNLFDNF